MWHYGRALGYAGKRQFDEARREQPEFEKLRNALDRNMPWDTNKLGDVMDLASAALAARLESSPALAVPKWKHAVALQDALAYDELSAWYYPIRESWCGDAFGGAIPPVLRLFFAKACGGVRTMGACCSVCSRV